MTLTEWFPCTVDPHRPGWYDVMRVVLGQEQPVERVRYSGGAWDIGACESRIAIWKHHDYWRGVQGEGK